MSSGVSEAFLNGLQCLHVNSDKQGHIIEQLALYRRELLDWNTRMNLTAITEPDEVLIKHFLDSLSLLLAFDREQACVLDIGSGAGFPGIPLKIVRPQWQVTLLEATGKRINFLRHIIAVLQLDGIDVVQGRAEEIGRRDPYRAAFDLVTARAVAALPTLLEYCAPFCRVNGTILLPKKGQIADELIKGKRAASQLGATLVADILVDLPGLTDDRRLLVWKQQKLCSARFPRSGAAIAKHALA
jgi:16S rRNA (guanine527-N7)-methyltransferase